MQIFLIAVAGGMVLHVAMLVALILKIEAWGRDMEKRSARREREHQEYMVSLKIDARRRSEDHERFMKRLNARRR